MTRRTIPQRVLVSTALAAAFAVLAGPALAQDDTTEEPRRTRRQSEILLSADAAPREQHGWLSPNFHLHKKSGFAYTRQLKVGEHPFVFRVQGPVLRKQEAIGIAFGIRF